MCLAFSRLVESFQNEQKKLHIIAGNDLLKNLQQLVSTVCLSCSCKKSVDSEEVKKYISLVPFFFFLFP